MVGRVLIVALGVAASLAGCAGSDTEAGRPTSSAPSTTTPAPEPAHAAPELEALLPDEVEGVQLTKGSATGADVFGSNAFSEEMTRFLASEGKEPADLRFANASAPPGTLEVETGVFEAGGVGGRALLEAIVESSLPEAPGLTTSTATLAGKRMTALAYANGATLYLYASGGRVFYVGTGDEAVARAVAALLP